MEIEEALYQLKQNIKMHELEGTTSNSNEREKALLDYITNLQKENKSLQLELSGYRTAILKDDKMLGLQDRIKELEQINEEHRRINGELREENKEIKNTIDFIDNKYKNTINYNEKLIEYNQDYKSRIDKAIELLNDWDYLDKIDCYYEPKKVIDILKGKSDE